MAHVREVERSGGTAYEVRWRDAGKFKQRTFTVKREAERFAFKVENELEDGQSTAALVKNAKTFREVAELMQAAHAHTLKPKTRRDTASAFTIHIYPTFGARRINTITTMDIEAWLADQRAALKPKPKDKPNAPDEHYSQSSIRTRYVNLAAVFKYATQLRLIAADPCAPVRIPKVQHDELTFLTAAQVNAVVEHMDAEEPDGLVVQFAAYTGLRAGELMGLRIRDVNLFARQPYVHVQRQAQYEPKQGWQYITPKTKNAVRKVPLHPVLVTRLREFVAAHPYGNDPEARLWPGRRRGGRSGGRGTLDYDIQFNLDNFYRKHFLVVLKELRIPAVRWHDLRHFYASACASAGIPIERVAKFMGHADISTMYKHYLHLFEDDHADDMSRLAAVASRPALAPVRQIG